MIKKIFKYSIVVILLIIVVFLFWFKFILSEFDEFKNATFFEDRKYLSTDGTYIMYEEDSVRLVSVVGNNEKYIIDDRYVLQSDFKRKIRINTYAYDKQPSISFDVNLFDSIINPESSYKEVEKILAISDIEGNFYAFYKMLKANSVIDENCNWIFDKGHLVLIGDFVDRGLNVTQVLWLAYKLDKQSQQSGGYVHFINGNHEIMNLSDKIYHVRSKYKILCDNLSLEYSNGLLGNNSELGKWLRSKNVVEKIGNNLFVHGGLSSEIISLSMSLDSINKISRKYYGLSDAEINKNRNAKLLYSNVGPFWFRGYTRNIPTNIKNVINKTKSSYNIRRIIIGHSTTSEIVGEYDNSVFDIDIHFPHNDYDENRGCGILIKGNSIYKLDDLGTQVEL